MIDTKSYYKSVFKRAFIVIGIFLILFAITILFRGNYFIEDLDYGNDASSYDLDDLKVFIDNEELVSSAELYIEDNALMIKLLPKASGEAEIFIVKKSTGSTITSTFIKIDKALKVKDLSTENFTGYRMFSLMLVILFSLISSLLFYAYRKANKMLGYSYESIFSMGFSIFMALSAIMLLYGYSKSYNMLNFYEIVKSFGINFMIITFPIFFIFSIALSISNVRLIKKEGYSLSNILGIGLSIAIILGAILGIFLESLFTSGSELEMEIFDSVIGIYYALYVLLECFLIGSIISGIRAAKFKPDFDKDYIIVLGCMIRPDGTPYPLLRGRIDKGLEFYKAQIDNSGKRAKFVVSGGKGEDEIISEALSMKNYLLSKGIEEKDIILEDKSKNTKENIRFSKRLMDEGGKIYKAVFSTTNYHVFRSGIISREEGTDFEGIGSSTKWYFWPNAFIREVIGMISYKKKTLVILFILITAWFSMLQFIS